MPRLISETYEDYLAHCQDDAKSQAEFVAALQAKANEHGKHEDCDLCQLFDETLETNHKILTECITSLDRAKRGIDD